MSQEPAAKQLGFWACWSLTVGVMIGSGIFLLPSVLAPYGTLSFAGWILTAGGSILLALVFARLAARLPISGGVYTYSRASFGDLTGFLIAWSYWTSYWIAIPGGAIAFVGYLSVFFPNIAAQPMWQIAIALALIWTCVLFNIKGVKEATMLQLVMTILKLIPLCLIIMLGITSGSSENFPPLNPQQLGFMEVLASTALLTMWAFSGMEAGAMPASNVKNASKTIPRAIIIGTLTVAFIYIGSTAAVMSLVPATVLASSTAPFADAAQSISWGPALVAFGALVSTAGSMNGILFVAGQLPMAVAVDKLAPASLAKKNKGESPYLAILLVGVLASILLLANFSKGLIAAYQFIITMSTLAFMLPLIVCSLAEFRHSIKSSIAWSGIALLALLYSIFATFGSGLVTLAWGLLFLMLGVPIFWLMKRQQQ